MKEVFKKRGRLEIICEMLSVCRKPAKKTNILYKCNLSYNQLQKYLEFLISRNLITLVRRKETDFYQIAEKGKEFLEEYERLNIFLEEEHDSSAIPRNNRNKNHIGRSNLGRK